jgi:hypothetical protein
VARAEKLAQHGAVTILRTADAVREPELGVSWAVFLPVEEGREAGLLGPRAAHSWTILFHGYFLPDSGRRHIPGIGAI